MTRAVVLNDDFTGTAGALSTDDANYTNATVGQIHIDGSGNAYPNGYSANCDIFRNAGAYVQNQYAEVTMGNVSSSDKEVHLILLASGAGGGTWGGYFCAIYAGTNKVYKVVGGTPTLVGSCSTTTQTWAAGDKFSAEVEFNTDVPAKPVFKLYKTPSGGSLTQIGVAVTDTVASPHTSGRPGFGGYMTGAPDELFTDFEAGSITAAAAFAGTAVPVNLRLIAAPASGQFGLVYRIVGTLVDPATGAPRANLTNINCAFFDQSLPSSMLAPSNTTTTLSTDANGNFSWYLPASALTAGQVGILNAYHAALGFLGAYQLTLAA